MIAYLYLAALIVAAFLALPVVGAAISIAMTRRTRT